MRVKGKLSLKLFAPRNLSKYRIDFTIASRVHLMEPHWNPMAEAQAVDRVHRIGQTQEVVITRYIVPKSIETVSPTTSKWVIKYAFLRLCSMFNGFNKTNLNSLASLSTPSLYRNLILMTKDGR